MIRAFIMVSVALIATAGAGLYAMSSPTIMERFVEWACETPTERCLVRMRALGHTWWRHENAERAEHWYRKSADGGDPPAMFHLAWKLERDGVAETIQSAVRSRGATISRSEKIDEAATWYHRAATANFAPAMNNLGNLHEQGLLGRRDFQESFDLYTAAAKLGNPVAAFNLSRAYGLGLGTMRNSSEAEKLAEWSPVLFNWSDLAEPTLERTYFGGSDLPQSLRVMLRAVADCGPPAVARLKLGPLNADQRVPTFSDVQQRMLDAQRR